MKTMVAFKREKKKISAGSEFIYDCAFKLYCLSTSLEWDPDDSYELLISLDGPQHSFIEPSKNKVVALGSK